MSQQSFASFTIASKFYSPDTTDFNCSGILCQLTDRDIALATEDEKGKILIFDYKRVFDESESVTPDPTVIVHVNFKIDPISIVMISDKYLLYVSNEKYVIVNVQTQKVEYTGDIKTQKEG